MEQKRYRSLNSLKWEIAKRWCNFFGNNLTYDNALRFYQNSAILLLNRKRLQRLAQKYQKQPIEFCERAFGKDFLATPKDFPKSKEPVLWEMLPVMDACLGGDVSALSEKDRKAIPKMLASLMADQRGRKRRQIYEQAALLAQQGKGIHEICLKLHPTYKDRSSLERRAIREQMRSGIKRALQRSNPTQ